MFSNSNRRQFQKGLDTDAVRADRRNAQLSLRRKQREAHIQKRVRLLTNKSTFAGDESSKNNSEPKPKIADIPRYIALVMQIDNSSLQLQGLRSIRKLLSMDRSPPVGKIARSGIVAKVIQFMYDNNMHIQFESAWIITNIAASNDGDCASVIQYGAIDAFVNIIRRYMMNDMNNHNNSNIEMIDQAIWGLGNICGDSKTHSDMVLQTNIINDILTIVNNLINININFGKNQNDATNLLLDNCLWLLQNMVRNKGLQLQQIENTNLVATICKILQECKNEAIIENTLWALCYLSSQNDEICHFITRSFQTVNICMKLLNNQFIKYEVALNQFVSKSRRQQTTLINTKTESGNTNANSNTNSNRITSAMNPSKQAMLTLTYNIYVPCLRFIGNILSGEDDLTQIVLDCGYLDIVGPFLNHFIPRIRKEVTWSLSNVLAGSHQQIEHVLSRENIIETIMNSAFNDVLVNRAECIHAICNATAESTASQKKKLAEYGAIEALCSVLNPVNTLNSHFIQLIIEGLGTFLQTYSNNSCVYNAYAIQVEECKGLDYLENRQADTSLSEDTYQQIVTFMAKYWPDDDAASAVAATENQFDWTQTNTIDKNTTHFKFGACLNQNNNSSKQTFNF